MFLLLLCFNNKTVFFYTKNLFDLVDVAADKDNFMFFMHFWASEKFLFQKEKHRSMYLPTYTWLAWNTGSYMV